MDINLTKEAEKMLAVAYKIFLDRRKQGKSRLDSKRFNLALLGNIKPFDTWPDSDINDVVFELAQNCMVKVYLGGDFDLTDLAIAVMQTRFKNGLIDVLSFISQFV